MIVKFIHEENKEIEVDIRYSKFTPLIKRLKRQIESFGYEISCFDDIREYRIRAESVYYIESFDKKTYIHTETKVFKTKKKLYQILEELKDFEFIQISKYCILNLNVMESFKTLSNSRIEVKLLNNETLFVSRTYLSGIRKALSD